MARAACGPLLGSPANRTPEQVFASSTPKFTVSATPQDNELVVDGFLGAVERLDEGPGLRGYGLVLVGPNWSMSSPDETVLLDARSAIGGTLLSTNVEINRFFVPDLFERGFFTGATTVLLGAYTAFAGIVFLGAVVIGSRRKRAIPVLGAWLALLGVAGLVGVFAFNWFSWITRSDGYGDVRLMVGFYVVTIGAVLGVAALAAIVMFPRTAFRSDWVPSVKAGSAAAAVPSESVEPTAPADVAAPSELAAPSDLAGSSDAADPTRTADPASPDPLEST